MKNFKLSRLLAAAALVACLSFTACKPAEDTTTQQIALVNTQIELMKAVQKIQLTGTWVESGSWGNSYYKVTENGFENYGDSFTSYAGDNLVIDMITPDSGTMFIKYTRAPDSNWNYTTDPALAPDIGKWYAISFKNLTNTTIKLSGANKTGGRTSCASLSEARTEFTVENGYFYIYSACSKR